MRVLYVEDNPANVFLVKRVAKMGNHEIINYVDGTEALSRYKTINPDLVLMDLQISGDLNGLDVVKQLRLNGVTTPIIAVTAYAMVGDRERCLAAGCDDYMAKPLPIPQLVQVFERYASSLYKTSELAQLGTDKASVGRSVPSVPVQVVSERITQKQPSLVDLPPTAPLDEKSAHIATTEVPRIVIVPEIASVVKAETPAEASSGSAQPASQG